MGDDGDRVRVAVRVRPFNRRELDTHCKCIVRMHGSETEITDPETRNTENPHTTSFAFDHSLWSFSNDDPLAPYADQSKLYNTMGKYIIDSAMEGYNTSMFAYGQTGSGKTFTIMGYGAQKGIVPQAMDDLFQRVEVAGVASKETTITVEVAYYEIYNEKVRDLLNPESSNKVAGLKVREHPKTGPYVEGLIKYLCRSPQEVLDLMEDGGRMRAVAATAMNAVSSRSHAIVQLTITQVTPKGPKEARERRSKVNFVDLAGSERAVKSNAASDADRFREAQNINKSLSQLGNVISALADGERVRKRKSGRKPSVMKSDHIPYRNSVLTWILKDSLGGNSRTSMIATISPADDNYEESLSTLRYADRAKSIMNKATVNEDENTKIVNDLRREIDALKKKLGTSEGSEVSKLRATLMEKERLINDLQMTLEDKVAMTMNQQAQREALLQKMGLLSATADKTKPHLVNLHEDPFMTGTILYYVKDGRTTIGAADGQDLRMQGLGMEKNHAILENKGGKIIVSPMTKRSRVFVNGKLVKDKAELLHGDRVIFGNNQVFKLSNFKRGKTRLMRLYDATNSTRSMDPEEQLNFVDYAYAMKELNSELMKNLMSADSEAASKLKETQKKIETMEGKIEAERKQAEKRLADQQAEFERKIRELEEEREEARKGKKKGTRDRIQQLEDRLTKMREEKKKRLSQRRDDINKHAMEGMSMIVNDIKDLEKALQENKKQAALEDELMKGIQMTNEASEMSETLRKDAKFDVRVGANDRGEKQVFAIATDKITGTETKMPLDEFQETLFSMREYYMAVEENDEEYLAELDGKDPFSFGGSSQHIGSARLILKALAHGMPIDVGGFPIIDDSGAERGILEVGVIPVDEYGDEMDDVFYDEPSEMVGNSLRIKVVVKGAKGLPDSFCKNVYVAFSVPGEEGTVRTPATEKSSINPLLNYEKVFEFDSVEQEIVDYLSEETMVFKVFGALDEKRETKRKTRAISQKVLLPSVSPASPRDRPSRASSASSGTATPEPKRSVEFAPMSPVSQASDAFSTLSMSDVPYDQRDVDPVTGTRITSEELEEIYHILTQPSIFAKYSTKGDRQYKQVFVDEELQDLHWTDLDFKKNPRKIALREVKELKDGRETSTFSSSRAHSMTLRAARRKSKMSFSKKSTHDLVRHTVSNSFSIIAAERSLDLEAENSSKKEAWCRCFRNLLRHLAEKAE